MNTLETPAMLITVLKGKIHRATVSGADLNYEGSISICTKLMADAGIVAWEKVEIYNINTGARFSTYVIEGQEGEIGLNGAAARLVQKGDLIIIAAYCSIPATFAKIHEPRIVLVDHNNRAHAIGHDKRGGATLLA
jgi:aspartate 1-decarboxylase